MQEKNNHSINNYEPTNNNYEPTNNKSEPTNNKSEPTNNKSELTNNNYELTNAINKERKLAAIRAEILSMQSEKALDVILEASFPVNLVQSFPEQDLYFLMHHIGKEDFLPVLALASSSQWEYIIDVEVWNNDRLDLVKTTNILDLLYQSDPQRLVRWAIKEKIEFIEYYFFKNIEIRIREHDEDPSDFEDDFVTIDSVFYFRFPNIPKEAENTETLITNMLNTLADMDMSVFNGFLLEIGSVIPAEIEEEEFRLKNVRLSEKGFLPPHEAVAVYQPLKIKNLKKRPAIFFKMPFLGSGLPLPPQYPSFMIQKNGIMQKSSIKNAKTLFVSALNLLDKSEDINNKDIVLNLQSEFAFLVNSVISADKKNVNSREALEIIVEKVCCYFNLGIEMIHDKLYGQMDNAEGQMDNAEPNNDLNKSNRDIVTPKIGALILRNYALKDIFRVASGAVMALRESARGWYNQSHIVKTGLPLTFLGENWLGVIGGILLDRPLFFDNYTIHKTNDLYRPFNSLEDIQQTKYELESIVQMDKMVAQLNSYFGNFIFNFAFNNNNKNIHSNILSRQFLTWKALFLTLWAMQRMGLQQTAVDSSIDCYIPLEKFKPFFVQLLDLKGKKSDTQVNNSNNDGKGKIDKVIRNDFFNWLCEIGILESEISKAEILDKPVLATVRKIFESVFNEIEEDYGTISPEDIDPKLISHFIVYN